MMEGLRELKFTIPSCSEWSLTLVFSNWNLILVGTEAWQSFALASAAASAVPVISTYNNVFLFNNKAAENGIVMTYHSKCIVQQHKNTELYILVYDG